MAQGALTVAAGWRLPNLAHEPGGAGGPRSIACMACFGHAESAFGGRLLRGREQVIVNAEMKQRAE